MKIHSFAVIVASPFIIVAGVILYYLFFEDKSDWYPYLIPLAVILAAIYAYHPAIDYWWHQKHPPELPGKIKKLIYNGSRLFQGMDDTDRQKFLDRVSILMHHKAFYLMRKEKEALPEDVKALFATCAITLTFHEELYFFKKFDYFIAYQHPFPSPNKQYLHSVEVNHQDGVVLINADQLFQSMIAKTGAFNVGIYAFAEIYLVSNPLSALAQAQEPDPASLPKEGQYSYESIVNQIGYREVYFKAILTTLYFEAPEILSQYYPEFLTMCNSVFSNQGKPPS